MFAAHLRDLATHVLNAAGETWWILTAESCTGGLVAACLTEIAGSSRSFNRGYVTYANEAKSNMIGVPPALIDTHGAVSQPVAEAMAEGTLRAFWADTPPPVASRSVIAVAITGVAGPGGGSPEKPVGLVHTACVIGSPQGLVGVTTHQEHRFGALDRSSIREKSVEAALKLLLHHLQRGALTAV